MNIKWIQTPKGVKGDVGGKIVVPDYRDTHLICLKHGNLVLEERDTAPGERRGVIIVRIAPCERCEQDKKIWEELQHTTEVHLPPRELPEELRAELAAAEEAAQAFPPIWADGGNYPAFTRGEYGLCWDGTVVRLRVKESRVMATILDDNGLDYNRHSIQYRERVWERVPPPFPPEIEEWQGALAPQLPALGKAREQALERLVRAKTRAEEMRGAWEKAVNSLSDAQVLKWFLSCFGGEYVATKEGLKTAWSRGSIDLAVAAHRIRLHLCADETFDPHKVRWSWQ